MERLRFGIIGVGARGICNARAVAARPDIELVGVCDIRPERLEECARQGITAPGFTHYPDLLAEGLDAVCINTDNNVHAEITLAAVRQGCHVYCEKPIALSVADAEAMTQACREAGVATVVNLSMRLMPQHRKLREMVQQGVFGRLLAVGATHPKISGLLCQGKGHKATLDPATWGSLILHDGVHICEWLRFMGGEVKSVYARTVTTGEDPWNEELISAVTTHEGGVMGSLGYFTVPFLPQRQYVVGTEASGWPAQDENGPCIVIAWGKEEERVPVEKPALTGDAAAVDEFVRAIREGHRPYATMEDGLAGQRIVDAIRRSAREEAVITL
ncbi:MAG TPA: Gfo/Idh/MocA family oxidoreductase [Armatimonadota bacterium]|nr:Gfo/Idh/MocA family oxidoreductase [Armatimonadota bacterium]HPO74645.1 Gfo/Idh/MocA family oxidoreductase [Armatimonadota bacterium]